MRGTRRAGAVAAFVAVLTVLAVVIDRLLPLVGAALLAGWFLARQSQFIRAATTTADALSTEVTAHIRKPTFACAHTHKPWGGKPSESEMTCTSA